MDARSVVRTKRDGGELSAAADERYHGHVHAGKYVMHSVWLAMIGVFTVPAGFELAQPPWSWLLAGAGVLLIASAFGIWRASEWARVTSGVLILTLAGAFFWLTLVRSLMFDTWFIVVVLCVLVGTGLEMLSPMAARRFQRARAFRSISHGKRY